MEVKAQHFNEISIITIYDSISIQNIQAMEKIWEKELERNITILAINFSKVDRVDSIGLSHLVKLSRNAIIKEIELIFYGLHTPILELFKIARLDTFFNILSEEEFEDKYPLR